ncbi:MAG: GNAT family N-acetyltransferase [bacterium]|nr:GNAT family N-acetyltransferase [Candidatus Sumerlaeota bacterium]
MTTKDRINTRRAKADDAPVVVELIKSLAHFEQLTLPDEETQSRLVRDGFGKKPRFTTLLAEVNGKVVGYAIMFETYSSFLALPTLFLEDIFILPEYRGVGAGLALFKQCVAEAECRGCGRMEWMTLHWNIRAQNFWKKLGAKHLKEWYPYRLVRPQFAAILSGQQK